MGLPATPGAAWASARGREASVWARGVLTASLIVNGRGSRQVDLLASDLHLLARFEDGLLCDASRRRARALPPAAHAKGIVHRDLKPENVFVAQSKRRGVPVTVKVLDFGIAKTVQDSRTAVTVTAAIGSPLFMAPEQGSPGAQLRPSTDLWALGLICALTGEHYWKSASRGGSGLQTLLAEVMVLPLDPPSVRLRELGRDVELPPGFDAWFARCVARAGAPVQRGWRGRG